MFYAVCLDLAISDWGRSRARKNVLVLECSSFWEGLIVCCNMADREELQGISLFNDVLPEWDENMFYVSYKTLDEYPKFRDPGRPFYRSPEEREKLKAELPLKEEAMLKAIQQVRDLTGGINEHKV